MEALQDHIRTYGLKSILSPKNLEKKRHSGIDIIYRILSPV
jgi:hypothetical protein